MEKLIIHHSADFDGKFCGEIAHKFLPDHQMVGWDFADPPLQLPEPPYHIVVLDLPVDRPFGFDFSKGFPEGLPQPLDRTDWSSFVWIDHHHSSIQTHPPEIPGYRIDGVAACRLAWQWFANDIANKVMSDSSYLPSKDEYLNRSVNEPIAVRLAGEYDIWDRRDPDAELFQHALRSRNINTSTWGDRSYWDVLLSDTMEAKACVNDLLVSGKYVKYAQKRQDEFIAKNRSFDVKFEGLNFMAINSVRCNSLTFDSAVQPHHDGLLGFFWNGQKWTVSLYHAPHRKDLDLSKIAVKYGGGGHKGACGFSIEKLPFLL